MLNTIRMDLYHAFKSKSLYITLLIVMLSFIASIASIKLETKEQANAKQELVKEDQFFENMGVQMGSMGKINEDDLTVDTALAILFNSGTLLLMGTIFCVIYATSEHTSGFIKSVISKKNYRLQTSISKTVTMAVYSFIEIVICFGTVVVSLLLFFHKARIDDIGVIIRYLGMQLLLQTAILSLCILVCNIFRNIGITMAFAICLSTGLFTLIPQLIDHLKLPVKISDYLLTILIRILPLQYDNTLYLRALIMGLICLAAFQMISTIVMKRQDIK